MKLSKMLKFTSANDAWPEAVESNDLIRWDSEAQILDNYDRLIVDNDGINAANDEMNVMNVSG